MVILWSPGCMPMYSRKLHQDTVFHADSHAGSRLLISRRPGRHCTQQLSCYPDPALGSVDLWCCISWSLFSCWKEHHVQNVSYLSPPDHFPTLCKAFAAARECMFLHTSNTFSLCFPSINCMLVCVLHSVHSMMNYFSFSPNPTGSIFCL